MILYRERQNPGLRKPQQPAYTLITPIQQPRPDSNSMDIQRIVLFAGLAIVSYLMVLAWNEDYHQPPETAQVA